MKDHDGEEGNAIAQLNQVSETTMTQEQEMLDKLEQTKKDLN